jgi:hypothetical protein
MAAMYDFVADINGGTVLFEREIHDIDRSIDPGAKSTRIGKIDFHHQSNSLLN